jgi:hypothetical protein
MALEIMKIVASATTTTSVGPTVTRFFRKVPSDVTGAATLTIDAADFLLDNGNAATTLPALSAGNSYVNDNGYRINSKKQLPRKKKNSLFNRRL